MGSVVQSLTFSLNPFVSLLMLLSSFAKLLDLPLAPSVLVLNATRNQDRRGELGPREEQISVQVWGKKGIALWGW